MYDLTVAYRIYPKISKVPAIYPDDKFKMSEICIKSFADALGSLNTKIYILLDGCPPEYKELFENNLSKYDLEYIELDGIGNGNTFGMQLDILKDADTDYVYFAEDDYFYLEDSIQELLEFCKKNSIDFATPYDHLDYYEHKLHRVSKLNDIQYNNKTYIERLTTTMTFLANKKSLNDCYNIFLSYKYNNWDNSMWLAITSSKLINPFEFLRLTLFDMQMFKMYVKSLVHTPKYLFNNKKYKLFVPHPGTATHLDNQYLSPKIEWQEKFKRYL